MKKSLVLIFCILLMTCSEDKPENIKLTGPVFGTAFNIKYTAEDDVNYITQIDSLFDVVNKSLSTYLPRIEKYSSNASRATSSLAVNILVK